MTDEQLKQLADKPGTRVRVEIKSILTVEGIVIGGDSQDYPQIRIETPILHECVVSKEDFNIKDIISPPLW